MEIIQKNKILILMIFIVIIAFISGGYFIFKKFYSKPQIDSGKSVEEFVKKPPRTFQPVYLKPIEKKELLDKMNNSATSTVANSTTSALSASDSQKMKLLNKAVSQKQISTSSAPMLNTQQKEGLLKLMMGASSTQ